MPGTRPTVALFGTLDTKGPEYAFVRERLEQSGCSALTIDTGVLGEPKTAADFDRAQVAEAGGADLTTLTREGDRGAAMSAMARGAAAIASRLHGEGRIDAVMGLGGSNGAYVLAQVAAALPVGLPKMLVSTIAAGDTRPYVGGSDLTLMYPIVDISGLNRVSKRILTNAAAACAGMACNAVLDTSDEAPVVAISMFGVTTPCCVAVRDELANQGVEPLTFHATGVGGISMEGLIRSGHVQAVADITTTELADSLVGGVCSAGSDRLTAASRAGVPQVVSLGALDMVNFGAPDTVPSRFRGRRFHQHNPNVTLMRTSPDECAQLGAVIAERLNAATAPVAVLIPLRGVSEISTEGKPFHDPQADEALFDALVDNLEQHILVRKLDTDINDTSVSASAVELITEWLDTKGDRLA